MNLQIKRAYEPAAPTGRLWFGQDVARLVEFRRRYLAELKSNATALNPVREALQHGSVTLVYAAQDEAHNQAGVLRELLSTSSPRSNPFGPESRRTQTSSRC